MFNQDENSLEQGLSTSIGKASVDLAKKKKKYLGIKSKHKKRHEEKTS
jgi:hypothetical protein